MTISLLVFSIGVWSEIDKWLTKNTPKKEISEAIEYAESKGWRVEAAGGHGHAWGRMYCPYKDGNCRCGEFCIISIWSTPKNPGNHARQIRRVVDNYTGRPIGDNSQVL